MIYIVRKDQTHFDFGSGRPRKTVACQFQHTTARSCLGALEPSLVTCWPDPVVTDLPIPVHLLRFLGFEVSGAILNIDEVRFGIQEHFSELKVSVIDKVEDLGISFLNENTQRSVSVKVYLLQVEQ